MIAPETASLGILARWYAEPCSCEEASALLELANRREQAILKRGGHPYLSPILRLIARYWLGEPIEGYYQHLLSKRTGSAHAELLKPLIYGQLLMSRLESGAMVHLDDAFHRARLLLHPQDYFTVMKRHQLLSILPSGGVATTGKGLEPLLTTAAVIERMNSSRGERPGFTHDPNDTYG